MEVRDSNGNILADGDSVTLTKDLKVKGMSVTLKRGTLVKKIRLTDDPAEVDCKVSGSDIVLRTEFLKKPEIEISRWQKPPEYFGITKSCRITHEAILSTYR